jgi:hypothetical protein
LTRPAKPCTDDRKRAPLADWNRLGGVKISDFLKNGSRPDQVHVLSLLSCPQASYCSFSARGWGAFPQNVASAGVVTRGTYEYHAIDDGAPAEGLPGVHCEGTTIEVRLWDGCVGLTTLDELRNNLNRASTATQLSVVNDIPVPMRPGTNTWTHQSELMAKNGTMKCYLLQSLRIEAGL